MYFAGDGLDLTSRSGRLAADIQAVVAADYVRNLREETKCGILRRLEQGLYPMRAATLMRTEAGRRRSIRRAGRSSGSRLPGYASGEYSLLRLQKP